MTKRNTMFIGVLAFLIVGFSAGVFVFGHKVPVANKLPTVSEPLPDALLKGLDGRDVKLSDFRGKPLIINFWTSWCPLCTDELRQLVFAQKEFSEKILVIAINRGESSEQIQSVSQKLGIDSSLLILLDNDDTLYQTLGGFSMPETLFIDKDGMIREHQRGPAGLEELRRRVQDSFHL